MKCVKRGGSNKYARLSTTLVSMEMSVDKFGRHLGSRRVTPIRVINNGNNNILKADGNFDFRGKRLTNVSVPIKPSDVVIKEYVDDNFLTAVDQGDYSFKNKRLKQVRAPLSGGDAVNKEYVDDIKRKTLLLTHTDDSTEEQFNANNHRIVQMSTPLEDGDAVNKKYLDTIYENVLQLDDENTWNLRNRRLKNVGSPTASFDAVNKVYVDTKNRTTEGHYWFGRKRLTSVGAPIDDSDTTTKLYVDEAIDETKRYVDSKSAIQRTDLEENFWFENKILRGVAAPLDPADGANKNYVDAAIEYLQTEIARLKVIVKLQLRHE